VLSILVILVIIVIIVTIVAPPNIIQTNVPTYFWLF
jgi:hypothetical protein